MTVPGTWTIGTTENPGGEAGLVYDASTRGAVPIPPAERALQTVEAKLWCEVSDQEMVLEGPAFERTGDMVFCDVSNAHVLRVTPDRRLTTVISTGSMAPTGLAIHRDGRIYITAADIPTGIGAILVVAPDGSGLQTIVPPDGGYVPNDLVFDRGGGFYFTDFRGTSTNPAGGVYYASENPVSITAVILRLAMGNGIALSPDGKTLWATEYARNLLHRVVLASATFVPLGGTAVAYHFIGPAPDSMRADADGNLYVAMHGQGRVLVFNPNGLPIGQVLLPGRDEGNYLISTSMCFRPGTNDLFIVSSNGVGRKGAAIFHTRAFANALPLYSHQ